MVTCKANPSLQSYHPFLSFLFKKVQILLDVTGALKPLQRNQESDTQRHHWSLLSSVPVTFFFFQKHTFWYIGIKSQSLAPVESSVFTPNLFSECPSILSTWTWKKISQLRVMVNQNLHGFFESIFITVLVFEGHVHHGHFYRLSSHSSLVTYVM